MISGLGQETIYDVCDYDEYIRDDEHVLKTDDTCIGSVLYPNENGEFLLDIDIDPQLFFKFNESLIYEFLQLPIHPEHRIFGKTEIVQIKIIDEAYTVIIKTFWIRIIQRTWKRHMKERNEWLQSVKRNMLKHALRIHDRIQPEPRCNGILSYLV